MSVQDADVVSTPRQGGSDSRRNSRNSSKDKEEDADAFHHQSSSIIQHSNFGDLAQDQAALHGYNAGNLVFDSSVDEAGNSMSMSIQQGGNNGFGFGDGDAMEDIPLDHMATPVPEFAQIKNPNINMQQSNNSLAGLEHQAHDEYSYGFGADAMTDSNGAAAAQA